MAQLPSKLRKNPFTFSQASKLGISRYQLRKLVSEGLIDLVARGVFCVTTLDLTEEVQYRIAVLQIGEPSAICLVSALSYYGLTDIIPKKTWVMVPFSKRSQHTNCKILRTRNPLWKVGITKHNGYSITTIERTIIDSICARARLGTVGTEAMRKAVQAKQTTLGKVMDMAIELKVVHRVRPYIEALA